MLKAEDRHVGQLNDTTVEDILSMTDEEILAEVIENGKDPAEVAARLRAFIKRVTDRYRN